MRKKRFILISILVIMVLAYMLGPNPKTPKFETSIPLVPNQANLVPAYLEGKEASHRIKPDNQARVVWANDSAPAQTEYCIVYLHGFSACQEEGNPTHRTIASVLGANLLLTRLAYHGIDTMPNMQFITIDALWESAKEALALGRTLGKKVVLMGTSTGGTLALLLAAYYPDQVAAVVNMSPNIRLAHPLSFIANNPWGVQIGRLVVGGPNQVAADTRQIYKQYWYPEFRLESVAQLQELLEVKMNKSTYEKVYCPVLNLYYYKSETEQDDVVSTQAIKEMHELLASSQKRLKAMPTVGDHVMGSHIKSKDLPAVYDEIKQFLAENRIQ